MSIERILGTDKGKDAFYKADRNFVKLESALNINYNNSASDMTATNVQEAVNELNVEKLSNEHNTDATSHNDIRTKITNLEKEICTMETVQIAESYNSAISIPSTAEKGKLDVSLKGLSAVNLPKNGNFVDTSNWLQYGGLASFTVANNEATCKANTQYGSIYNILKTVVGNKYYAKADVKATANSISIGFSDKAFHSGSGKYESLSIILTATSTTEWFVIGDGRSSGWDNFYVKNVLCIDLTALDLAIKTKLDCDYMFPTWFDGLQGSTDIKVKSVGKNLFDGQIIDGKYLEVGYGTVSDNLTRSYAPSYITIKKSTQYHFKSNYLTPLGYYIFFYDTNKKYISEIPITNDSNFTTPENARFIRWMVSGNAGNLNVNNTLIQLEEGTTATPYEPYKESISTYKTLDGKPLILHRLPNGVCDEVTTDGKLIKRIGEYTSISDVVGAYNNYPDYDMWYLRDIGVVNIESALVVTPNQGILRYFADDTWGALNVNTFRKNGTSGVALRVAKGTYTDLASAQIGFAGTKIIYQLATPEVLDTNATPLVAEPNGTVFVTSENSPQPLSAFRYPVNFGGVIDGLLEAQKEQSKILIRQNAINLNFDLRLTTLEH